MTIEYKFESYWSEQDGWHFSFGNMKMWEEKDAYIVAEERGDAYRSTYVNHKVFENIQDALNYMRTGKI